MTGQATYGALRGGATVRCSLGLCGALLRPANACLAALGRRLAYEVAIGLNGRVWCRAATLGDAIVVANALENAAFLEDTAVAPMVGQVINAMRAKTASQGGYAQAVSGDSDLNNPS